jgi:acyl-[acyl-carrier-protein] desaturase
MLDLPIERLRPIVTSFNEIADSSNWNRFSSIPSEEVLPDLLSEGQKEAIAFCTVVEDHTPRYIEDYRRRFPIDAAQDIARSLSNRELFHFLVRWGAEEDRHAQALAYYQVQSGIVENQEALEEELIRENIKDFDLGFTQPVQVFTYTFLQEKATQIYYQSLSRAVKEPILKRLLLHLSRDESRHFSFFVDMLDAFVECHNTRVLPLIVEVASHYRMPLFNTMPDYARKAVRMAREAPGYSRKKPLEILADWVLGWAEKLPENAREFREASREIRERNHLSPSVAGV